MAVVEADRGTDRDVGSTSLREQIAAIGTSWASAQRRLVELIVDLDRSGEWTADGAATCAHWVATALDIEVSTAREWLRVGRVLEGLPLIAAAYRDGSVSFSKVRTLTRVATPANEAELLELAEATPAGGLNIALASWLSRRESPVETEHRHQRDRGVWWTTYPDGMVVGHFRLPPTDAERMTAAIGTELLHARRDEDASADAWPSFAQQRADALVRLVANHGARFVTEIVMHVRSDGATFDDGTPIPWTKVEQVAPEAFVRALIHDCDGRPINASGRHRHPTSRQRRVVKERDRTCVDCGATDFLEYDHEPEHATTGRTVVEELRLRCASCHRARHAGPGTTGAAARSAEEGPPVPEPRE